MAALATSVFGKPEFASSSTSWAAGPAEPHKGFSPTVVDHVCNPRTQEAETGGLL